MTDSSITKTEPVLVAIDFSKARHEVLVTVPEPPLFEYRLLPLTHLARVTKVPFPPFVSNAVLANPELDFVHFLGHVQVQKMSSFAMNSIAASRGNTEFKPPLRCARSQQSGRGTKLTYAARARMSAHLPKTRSGRSASAAERCSMKLVSLSGAYRFVGYTA